MIITPASLTALKQGFMKEYEKGLGLASPTFKKIATEVPSTTSGNTYGWLGKWPGFREWIGDRVLNDLKAHAYVINNKSFESTVAVGRDEIEDDNIGGYSAIFQEMGRATEAFPDELVYSLLSSGFSTTCYDGQYFFDTDHPVNPEHDGTGVDVSVSNATINGAYVGEPWFLMDTTRGIKPLIMQWRKKPKFTSMVKDDDESVFMKKEYRYGVDLRGDAGFGLWQLAHGVKDDLTLANVEAAFNAMRAITADGGKPLGIKPNVLVVPSSLETTARKLIERETIDEGGVGVSNEWAKKLEVVVADYL